MNLCSDGHEEVAYVGKQCPVCEVLAENKDLIKENENLNNDITEINEQI